MFNTIIGVSNFERFFLDEKYITEAKFQSLIIQNTIEFEKQKLNGTVSGPKIYYRTEHIYIYLLIFFNIYLSTFIYNTFQRLILSITQEFQIKL